MDNFLWRSAKRWLSRNLLIPYPTRDYHRMLYEAMAGSVPISQNNFSYRGAEAYVVEDVVTEAKGETFEVPLGGAIILSITVTPKIFNAEKEGVLRLLKRHVLQAAEAVKAGAGTGKNWLKRADNIEQIMQKVSAKHNTSVGFSVGNLFNGHYRSQEDNRTYSEDSFTVDVFGVSSEMLEDIAMGLGEIFNQRSVLIYDRNKNRSYFLETK